MRAFATRGQMLAAHTFSDDITRSLARTWVQRPTTDTTRRMALSEAIPIKSGTHRWVSQAQPILRSEMVVQQRLMVRFPFRKPSAGTKPHAPRPPDRCGTQRALSRKRSSGHAACSSRQKMHSAYSQHPSQLTRANKFAPTNPIHLPHRQARFPCINPEAAKLPSRGECP